MSLPQAGRLHRRSKCPLLSVHLFRKEIGKLQIRSSAPQEQQTGHSIDVQLFALNSEQS